MSTPADGPASSPKVLLRDSSSSSSSPSPSSWRPAAARAASNPWPTPVFVEAVTQAPLGSRETAYDPPRPAPALRLTDGDGRPFDLASLRGRAGLRLLRLHPLPRRLPDDAGGPPRGDQGGRRGREGRLRDHRPGPRRRRGDEAVHRLLQGGLHRPHRDRRGDRAAAEAWGVSYQQLPSDSASGYAMAHSTDAYLVDAEGQLRHHIFFGAGSDLIAREAARGRRPSETSRPNPRRRTDARTPTRSGRVLARLAPIALVALLVAACSGAAGDIKISEPWARTSPMVAGAGAAYMVIENKAPRPTSSSAAAATSPRRSRSTRPYAMRGVRRADGIHGHGGMESPAASRGGMGPAAA